MEILICKSNESKFTIMSLAMIVMFREQFSRIWSPEPWIPFDPVPSERFLDPIILFMANPELEIIGLKAIIPKVINYIYVIFALSQKSISI